MQTPSPTGRLHLIRKYDHIVFAHGQTNGYGNNTFAKGNEVS